MNAFCPGKMTNSHINGNGCLINCYDGYNRLSVRLRLKITPILYIMFYLIDDHHLSTVIYALSMMDLSALAKLILTCFSKSRKKALDITFSISMKLTTFSVPQYSANPFAFTN